jgi:hypothetical protein
MVRAVGGLFRSAMIFQNGVIGNQFFVLPTCFSIHLNYSFSHKMSIISHQIRIRGLTKLFAMFIDGWGMWQMGTP